MTTHMCDLVFLSYSRKDPEIYAEVRQYFHPHNHEPVKPFEYCWAGAIRRFGQAAGLRPNPLSSTSGPAPVCSVQAGRALPRRRRCAGRWGCGSARSASAT